MLKDEVELTVSVTTARKMSKACKDHNLDLPRRNALHLAKATLLRNRLAT